MKRIWKYAAISSFVFLSVVSLWSYVHLSPARHFQAAGAFPLTMPNLVPLDTVGTGEGQVQNQEQDEETNETPKSDSILSSGPSPTATPSPIMSSVARPVSKVPENKSGASFNVVLIGTDTWGNEGSRADTIMVAHVMPDKRKVNIVSIPRDTRTYVQGVGYTKINHAHIVGETKGGNRQGTLTLIQAVSDFLNIPVHHYIKTNFTGVSDFIDTIGGIDMAVDQDVVITPEITIEKGDQHLDGQHALFLARERYSVPGGDFGRQTEQFRIVRAVARQLLKPEHLGDLAGLLTTGKKDIIDTSFRDSDFISLAWLFKGMESGDFNYEQIPGKDSKGLDPLVGDEVYYWSADMEQVKSIRERLFTD